jgi:hypothetical protein
MVLGLLREFGETCENSDFNTNLRDGIEILHSRIKNGVGMFYGSLVCERSTKKTGTFKANLFSPTGKCNQLIFRNIWIALLVGEWMFLSFTRDVWLFLQVSIW